MRQLLLSILLLGTFLAEAQYSGRRGVRYIDNGTVFTVRRANDWSQDRREGRCRIRVRIDDDSDVELRGDQVRIRVLRGRPGRDEGSECNAPLPTSGYIRNFRFRGMEGRGNPRLVQEPDRGNYYVAVVNVQDPKGGDEGYTFELTWEWDGSGSGSGGGYPGRPPTRPNPPSGGGGIFDDPNSNSLQDMNTSIRGSGTLEDGTGRYALTDLSVRIRGDQCQITLVTDRRQQLEMSGRMSRNTPRCIIDSSNRGRTSGNAYIRANGNRVTGVDVSGNINGRNFTGNFTDDRRR